VNEIESAYMLLVIIYMLCAYMLLEKSFTCYWWWIDGVSMY